MKHLLLPILALAAWQSSAAAQQLAPSPAASESVESRSIERLRGDLGRIIAEPGWQGDEYGVLVVSLDRGDTLFSLNADLPLAPASNTKLFSTAAALYYLGPDFRFSTFLLGDGPVRNGVLEGDLILYGTGDPAVSGRMLEGSTAVMRRMVDSLVATGVREIHGDVVGDGSYFDDEWIGPGWQQNDLDAWYGAPVGGLSFAENVVSIRFQPSAPGRPAVVRTTPETRELALENRVRTVRSGASGVRFERAEGRLVAVGQVRAGTGGLTRKIPVVDPANYAAAALRAMLEQRGVAVRGRVRSVHEAANSRVSFASSAAAPGTAPRVLAGHLSPTLEEIAAVTNHVSHNLFAEALLKSVGRVVMGEGTFEAGSRAVRYFLECELGPEPVTISQVDGSGLSRNNLLTARTAIRLLNYMPRSGVWDSYFASLPQAAVPDGLEQRMRGTRAAENLRAKTGTIRRVSALSGYVRSAQGEQLAFSILANGVPSTARAKRSEDAIGARLAAFSREAAGAIGPAPAAATGSVSSGPSGGSRVHRVAKGETLDAIARRYGLSVEELRSANRNIEPRRLQIGQELRVPGE